MRLIAPGHRACAGCGEMLAIRMVLDALGKNTVFCHATGCMEVVTTPYPESAWGIPWIHVTFENAAAVASGVSRAFKKLGKKAHVVAIGGDGGMMDIGFQCISGAFERKEDIIVITTDNEAYMNTGIQRSSGTPYLAWTTTSPGGKKEDKKDMVAIAVAHGVPYAATATIAFPEDLKAKIKKAAENTPSYVHILTPCVPGWRIDSSMTVEVSRLAVETGVFPLYEVVDGKYRLTYKPKELKPVREYLRLQGRFKHLSESQIEEIQKKVSETWENFWSRL